MSVLVMDWKMQLSATARIASHRQNCGIAGLEELRTASRLTSHAIAKMQPQNHASVRGPLALHPIERDGAHPEAVSTPASRYLRRSDGDAEVREPSCGNATENASR